MINPTRRRYHGQPKLLQKTYKPSIDNPLLLAFSGRMYSGKTTASQFVKTKYNAVNIAFADTLKIEVFEYALKNYIDKDFDAYLAGRGIAKTGGSVPKLDNPDNVAKVAWINANKTSLRSLLQYWGDWRRSQDVDYFVKAAVAKVEKLVTNGNFVVTIDDLRYPNEIQAIEEVGFEPIRIQAWDETLNKRGANTGAPAHQSETALDGHYFDHVIHNNGDMIDLQSELDIVIENILRKNAPRGN